MNKYYGNKPGIVTQQEKEHTALVRDIAARGMVLLEHKGVLPIAKGSCVALYGYGAANTVFCGLGAASFTSREEVSIEEGLKQAGITVTSKGYLDRYAAAMQAEEDAYYEGIREASQGVLMNGVLKMYKEPYIPAVQPVITEADLLEAKRGGQNQETDTAIFVISRVAGEDADRRHAEGDYLLSKEEEENLNILSKNFDKLIVLLNVGAPMDTTYIRSLPNLCALLFVGQAAGVTGLSVADVLTGKVTPEGKLTDTWAEKYEDYPNAENFAAMNGNLDDEMYSEGIYVGYRYFDTFDVTPAYSFGYGLSYTEFKMEARRIDRSAETVCIETVVTNIGSRFAGREVVQVYVSAPSGRLDKAYQELKGFDKTKLLLPGESQTVKIFVNIRDFACYSEKDSAWILEPGDYILRVGNSSRNTKEAVILRINEKIICEQCKNLFPLDCEMEEMSSKDKEESAEHYHSVIAGRLADTNIPVIHISGQEFTCICHQYRSPLWKEEAAADGNTDVLRFEDVRAGKISLDDFVNSLTTEEMSYLCVGNAGEREDATFASYDGSNTETDIMVPMAPGTCDTTRELMERRGIPNMHMSDGGSGLRMLPEYEVDENGRLLTDGILSVRNVDKILGGDYIKDRVNHAVYEQYTTGLPMATMLAQTWDRELWRKCGEIEGKEMQLFHVELWLAPSMNIHRNPLCGRNFEYYSEDPLITGECAASVINAIQSFPFAGVTMKHFACNNQEDNRHGTNAHVSERTLREIYLKGFEIAAKKAHPAAIMSSYNLINGTHTANHYELLTLLARDEWGFDGMVMTDWGTTSQSDNDKRKYPASTCAGCIRAGNDLIMPGSHPDIRGVYEAVKKNEISMAELRLCVKRILNTMLRLEAGRK
ncbi:MAG: glycoside hydrolase family 3 N-terminal domain-containing protein [Eubacteriales bacterium]|nr:glycoside hydrolase family 3 N-terminal domain-containing protein [Eubacteriales bacterium]